MTLPRLAAIGRHWKRIPPLAVSVANIAAVLGVKRREEDRQDMQSLAEALGAGAPGFSQELPEWLKAERATTST